MDDVVLDRIAAWEASGVVDAATAARLREAESARSSGGSDGPGSAVAGAASFFGPGLSLVEMFAYIGGGFLLAGWFAFLGRLIGEADRNTAAWLTVGVMAVPAAVCFLIGVVLHGRSAREERAAGVVFVLSTIFIAAGVQANVSIVGNFMPWISTIAAGAALIAAAAYRWLHPSLLTQFGLLFWITAFVGAALETAATLLNPTDVLFETFGFDRESALALAVLSAIAWSATAVGIGILGLVESRADDPIADRRAALSRFWAGVVLVGGVAYSVMRSFYDDELGTTFRVLPEWVGVLLVLGVSAILVERAFRREAGAYVFAAALGLIIALTDLNVSYVAPTGGTEIALVVEGGLLLGAAVAAQRLTGQIANGEPPPASAAPGEAPA